MGLLKNFRRGFATNSSSSHSFVYMKNAQTGSTNAPRGTDFGWEDFRLDTVGEKLFYVLVQKLPSRGWKDETPYTSTDAMREYGHDFPEFEEEDFNAALDSYVDHQSLGTISLEQARDPHVVVFGGNDNDGYSRMRVAAEDEIDWAVTPLGAEEYHAETDERVKAKIKAALQKATDPANRVKPAGAKFHIGRDGGVKACRAKTKPCPYSETDHFNNKTDAETAVQERNSSF